MSRSSWCLSVLCVAVVSCAAPPTDQGSATSSSPPIPAATGGSQSRGTSQSPTIAVLQTQDRRIELHSGTRVTVRNNQGDLVADDLTLDELATRDPFLYEVCRGAFASNGGPYLDARLDTHREAPKAMGLLGD